MMSTSFFRLAVSEWTAKPDKLKISEKMKLAASLLSLAVVFFTTLPQAQAQVPGLSGSSQSPPATTSAQSTTLSSKSLQLNQDFSSAQKLSIDSVTLSPQKPSNLDALRNDNGISISLDGAKLVKVDKNKLLLEDKAELRRIIKALEGTIGQIPEFDFDFKKASTANLMGDNILTVHAVQKINGVNAGSIVMAVDNDAYLYSLNLTYINENQPNIIRDRMLTSDMGLNMATNALLATGDVQTIDPQEWVERGKIFVVVDAELIVVPIYLYSYGDYFVRINGLTGEANARSALFHGSTDTLNRVCVQVGTKEHPHCRNPENDERSRVIFGENPNTGASRCISDVFPTTPRPLECDNASYQRYQSAVTSLENYIPTIGLPCCRDMGVMFTTNYGTFNFLNIRVNSAFMTSGTGGFWNDIHKVIHVSSFGHQQSTENTKEIVAHEWGHGFLTGYLKFSYQALSGQSENFFYAFSEGYSDFLAVVWSRQTGVGPTNWLFKGDAARNPSTMRSWSVPNSDRHGSGQVFANFFYRMATAGVSGVGEREALRAAIYAAQNITPSLQNDGVLDVKDFSKVMAMATANNRSMRQAACKAWTDMNFPETFCRPADPDLRVALLGCTQYGETAYRASWDAADINTDFYSSEFFTFATGWYTEAFLNRSTRQRYLYNQNVIGAKYRLQACNQWYCTVSDEFVINDICGDPNPG